MQVRKLLAGLAVGLAAQAAMAVPSLTFIIDGDTFNTPFSITNSSDAGEKIVRFQLNLGGTGYVFDTVTGGAPGNGSAGTAFQASGGTGATTGLQNTADPVDGGTVLDKFFTGFDAGETFSWLIDVDPADPQVGATVFGNSLIGASIFIDFNDGQRLSGALFAVPNNSDASQFQATGITQTPNDLPEPASMALVGLALGAGALVRRRRA